MEAIAKVLGHGSTAVTAKHYAKPDSVLNASLRRVAEVLSSASSYVEESVVSEEAAVSAVVSSLSPGQLALLRKVILQHG